MIAMVVLAEAGHARDVVLDISGVALISDAQAGEEHFNCDAEEIYFAAKLLPDSAVFRSSYVSTTFMQPPDVNPATIVVRRGTVSERVEAGSSQQPSYGGRFPEIDDFDPSQHFSVDLELSGCVGLASMRLTSITTHLAGEVLSYRINQRANHQIGHRHDAITLSARAFMPLFGYRYSDYETSYPGSRYDADDVLTRLEVAFSEREHSAQHVDGLGSKSVRIAVDMRIALVGSFPTNE